VKAQPRCFERSRFILGNPWKNETYGYCCTDGRRAFFCLNNCTWQDQTVTLQLNHTWGLPDGAPWDVYRWHPKPAHLTSGGVAIQKELRVAMRPFEVVLLETVLHGDKPSLNRSFSDQPLPTVFSEPSRGIEVKSTLGGDSSRRNEQGGPASISVTGQLPPTAAGGTLVLAVELRQGDRAWAPRNTGSLFTAKATLAGQAATAQPVLGDLTYEVPWQAWRIPVSAAASAREFQLELQTKLPAGLNHKLSAHFLPH
jgi:hypothetical protein